MGNSEYTSQQLAGNYGKYAAELANTFAKLWEMDEHFKQMFEAVDDNGDPYFSLETALLHLGKALADTVTYASEYKEEAEKESDEKALKGKKK